MLNYKYLYLALFSTLLIIYASSIPDQALLGDDNETEKTLLSEAIKLALFTPFNSKAI
jgi:hypothetical protein